MKTYRRHYCDSNHRTIRTLAKCMFPRAQWIGGVGEYACLAWCRVLTVQLYRTVEEAEAAKRLIDSDACGGLCSNRHEIVRIVKVG